MHGASWAYDDYQERIAQRIGLDLGYSETSILAGTSGQSMITDAAERMRRGAERVQHSAFADQAVEQGHATVADLAAMAAAWTRWVEQPDGWFAILHGEILCTP